MQPVLSFLDTNITYFYRTIGTEKMSDGQYGTDFFNRFSIVGKVSHTHNVRPWWYPQVHETVLPKTSILAFPTGHFRILLLFFAQTEPERGACPLPNSNLPSAKSQSLLSHSLASKPAFGILTSSNVTDIKYVKVMCRKFECR